MTKLPEVNKRLLILGSCAILIAVCGSLYFFTKDIASSRILLGSHTQSSSTPSLTPTWHVSVASRTNDQHELQTEQALAQQRQLFTKVNLIMQNMTLEQKLGQLIMVEYEGNDYQNSGLQYMISRQHVGGLIYQESNHNFYPPDDIAANVKHFSEQANSDTPIPLLIATDQEGGLVNRLARFQGPLPSAQQIAATGDPKFAYAQGAQAAKWMLEMGINADFAPVVDVQTVDPPVLVTRMFGSDPKTVASYAGSFLDGLQRNGVIGCLKHFPGLGAISVDPHAGLPVVQRSKADLENIDLAPYKMLIQQYHPAMIMATDVVMPAIDPDLPAELSPKAINGVLRQELGYQGVVVTDGLYMLGISQRWPINKAAVMAIMAGVDMVEGPFTVHQTTDVLFALEQAVQQGKLSVDRIDLSVQRILMMKIQRGIIK